MNSPGSAIPPPRSRSRAVTAYQGLPGPLLFTLWTLFFIGVGALIGAAGPAAVREIAGTAAAKPGILAWYGVRVTGFIAYLAIAGSVIYGLLLSTKILDRIAHRPVSFALHKDLALVGLGLSILHGALLTGDQTYNFTPVAILVPFASPYSPAAVGIGQIAFYLSAIVLGSFYVRRQIGQRTWRTIHYLSFAAFVGVAFHGIASGTDSATPWAFVMYAITLAVAWFLLLYRILISIEAKKGQVRGDPLLARDPRVQSSRSVGLDLSG